MAEEHRGSEEAPLERLRTRESSFDDLVKVFASGTVSRRRLLGVMGKALVGSVLVSIPGVAFVSFGCCSSRLRNSMRPI